MKHPVDVHVGMKVRQKRWLLGMTQHQLGEKVGTKFQQIQKYETGMNRISASRLWEISRALETPIAHFFEGLNEDGTTKTTDVVAEKEAAQLVRSYYQIPPTQRRKLFDLAKVLSRD